MVPIQYDWCPYKKREFGHGWVQRVNHRKIKDMAAIHIFSEENGLRKTTTLLTP